MSADLGAVTYTAVTWTAGDVITEAKLDLMVANDQAYDSHSAQGLLLNNEKALAGKNSGGTAKNMWKINSDDEQVGGDLNSQWNEVDETWVYASTTTLTIAGVDLTTRFTKGTKVRLTNDGSVKTYYVVSSAFSTNTTVTLAGETDLANSAITKPAYSYADCPKGFKRGQDWYRARAYVGATQENITNVTFTELNLTAESYDPNEDFNTTDHDYTIPVSGYYRIFAISRWSAVVAGKRYIIAIFKGGSSQLGNSSNHSSFTNPFSPQITDERYFTKGDVLTVKVYNNSGVSTLDVGAGTNDTYAIFEFVGV